MNGRTCLSLVFALAACGQEEAALPPPALVPVTVPKPAPTALVGKCGAVAGTVEVHHVGLPYWEPVTEGTELRVDDWVRTQPGATVELQFSNGAKLAVEENSVVVVELPAAPTADEEPAPLVAVSKGTVRGVANDAANAPVLLRSGTKTQRVVASKGQAQVDYRVRATEQGTEIAVTKGTGVVEQGEQKVELTQGRATMATETLSAAVEIPDFPVSVAPGIDARGIFPSDKPLFLTWKPVRGITTYRVQLARDLSFSEDVKTTDVTTTSYELRPQARGLYVWRVASIGAGGVTSEYGFARRIYFEEERPQELLLTPEDGETFGYQKNAPVILFQWQAAAGATSYRLSVSRGADPLDKPVVTETTDAQRLEVKKLTAGEYSWGVYVRPGMKPIFLSTRKLVVKQMAKPKVKTVKSIQWTE
ncbi:MAG: FecR domain-containing protein [Archangium sp.]|nr:FecR domain-containing protein [Archangium sp.]